MTPNSMTGYARHQGHDDQIGWAWEIKAVNGRGLELKLRLPPGFDSLDATLRDMAQKRLKRGNVSVGLAVNRARDAQGYVVNEAALAHYVGLARKMVAEGGGAVLPATACGLLSLKGVIEASEAEDDGELPDQRRARLLADFDQALLALAEMRAAEGRRLAAALSVQLAEIADLVARAESDPSLSPEAIARRLREQVAQLIDAAPSLDEDKLLQEAALLVAKADIREELDRLKAHVDAAADMLAKGDAVGRRLDFLCQEFNREANTLCSKAGSVSLSRIGMDLKAVIEQFREQVQNIE